MAGEEVSDYLNTMATDIPDGLISLVVSSPGLWLGLAPQFHCHANK